jgi:hypothetical protein
MNISILNVDPVGEAKDSEQVSGFIDGLKKKWDTVTVALGKRSKISMVYVTKFLLGTLDGLIVFVDGLMGGESGADKKATVIAAVVVLYDYVVAQALPIWLKPFATSIKTFIIYTVISIAIDWIVSKYNTGAWKTPEITV